MKTPRFASPLFACLLALTPVACDWDFDKGWDDHGHGDDDNGGGDDGDHDDGDGDDGDHDDGDGDDGDHDESCDDDAGDHGGMDDGGDGGFCEDPLPAPDPGLMDRIVPNEGAEVIADCDLGGGYEVSSWRSADESETRLWVGGVYQTRDDHSYGYHPVGEGEVSWSIPGDNVLVISSYEPTDWTIELAEGGELSRVIAIGYHPQTVEAPDGVAVETYSYHDGDCLFSCGFELPGSGGGCEGEELVAAAESITGLSLYGFDGCYDATRFVY